MGAPAPPGGVPAAGPDDGRLLVFESAHDGYGDAQRSNLRLIYPRRNRRPYSYNRSIGNADTRWQGEIAAGGKITVLPVPSNQNAGLPLGLREWEDTVPNPLLILASPNGAGTDGVIRTYQSTSSLFSSQLGAAPTGAALHDDGAGVPYYYVALGAPNGGTTKVKRSNRASTITTCTNLVADKLLSLNNDLYITATRTGGTATSGVGKVPAGTDPSTAAQPSLTVAGFAGRSINNLAPSGDGRFPVVLKPEGVFVYDRALDLWANKAPWMELNPHPDNGKAFWHEQGDLMISLGQGGAVRFDGTAVTPYDPIPLFAEPNNDTTGQVIAAAGNTRHWGALVTKHGSKRQRTGGVGAGSSVIDVGITTDAGANYTSYGSVASDGDATTTVNINAMAAATGWIVVGSPNMFVGVYWDMLNKNAVSTGGLAIEVLTGGGWVDAAMADMTAADNINNAPFARSGWHMMQLDPSNLGATGWTPQPLNVGGSKTRYWARISYPIGGPLTNPTKAKGVELLPYRPSIDRAIFPSDGLDRAGVFPHLLFSRTSEDGDHTTHDYGTLTDTVDEIGAVMYGSTGGGSKNEDRSLFLAGRYNFYVLEMALDDRPAMTSWPIMALTGGVEMPAIDMGGDFSIEDFRVDGVEWNATGYLYYRFAEDGQPWTKVAIFDTLPLRASLLEPRVGRYLQVALDWKLTAAQARQVGRPRIIRIDCRPKAAVRHANRLPVQSPVIV